MLFNLLTQEKNLCLYNKIRYFARERQRERETERQRDTHRERKRETERERQRRTERDTERVALLILHRKQCCGFPN